MLLVPELWSRNYTRNSVGCHDFEDQLRPTSWAHLLGPGPAQYSLGTTGGRIFILKLCNLSTNLVTNIVSIVLESTGLQALVIVLVLSEQLRHLHQENLYKTAGNFSLPSFPSSFPLLGHHLFPVASSEIKLANSTVLQTADIPTFPAEFSSIWKGFWNVVKNHNCAGACRKLCPCVLMRYILEDVQSITPDYFSTAQLLEISCSFLFLLYPIS